MFEVQGRRGPYGDLDLSPKGIVIVFSYLFDHYFTPHSRTFHYPMAVVGASQAVSRETLNDWQVAQTSPRTAK